MFFKLYYEIIKLIVKVLLILSCTGGLLALKDYYRMKAGEAVKFGPISLKAINESLMGPVKLDSNQTSTKKLF